MYTREINIMTVDPVYIEDGRVFIDYREPEDDNTSRLDMSIRDARVLLVFLQYELAKYDLMIRVPEERL